MKIYILSVLSILLILYTFNNLTGNYSAKLAKEDKLDFNLQDYVYGISNKFPATPIKKLIFYSPRYIDDKTLQNQIHLDMKFEDIQKVSPLTFIEFLTNYVLLVEKFNCTNYKSILDKGVTIYNKLSSREIGNSHQSLPIITFRGEKISFENGFVTKNTSCNDDSYSNDLLLKEFSNNEEKFRYILESNLPKSTGTGWTMENGFIVTNRHVVENATRVYVAREDRRLEEASIFYVDMAVDLAILKINNLEFLPASLKLSSKEVPIGENIFTVGYPWTSSRNNSLPQTQITTGIVSSIPDDGINYQLSLAIQSGNSGGPLLNSNGEVVGVVVSKLIAGNDKDTPEQVSYAIKIKHLQKINNDLTQEKRAKSNVDFATHSTLNVIAPIINESILYIISM